MVSQNAVIAAFASTALISLAPNLILVFFPRFEQNSLVLSLGQCLAAGGLLGDVFLHSIPHSGGEGNHDVGLWILFGFSIFLIVDMIMRSISSSSSSHNHHQHGGKKKNSNDEDMKIEKQGESNASTILLNLTADALHNFTDGIAIGSSFSGYKGNNDSILNLLQSRGGLATLSILFHEIPHELGDFAILIKNGFSKKEAIFAQFGTALSAMVGTGVGLVLSDVAGDSLTLITAGGFVYLACVTIIPDILNDGGSSFKFRFAQILCFAIGVAFLYAVGLLEEMEGHSGHGHGHSHQHHDHLHHEQMNHGHQMRDHDHHHAEL